MLLFPPAYPPFRPVPCLAALFDLYPIGTPLIIGTDSSFWTGAFGGIQDGVALLTNALLHSNVGGAIDGIRPVVRIPIPSITFVSQ